MATILLALVLAAAALTVAAFTASVLLDALGDWLDRQARHWHTRRARHRRGGYIR